MSYADTIITLETDRGHLALSAYKVKSLRQIGPQETEITYTVGGDNETGWTSKAIVKQPFAAIKEKWMTAMRAWDAA
jgi:hypothetical protein